MLSWCHPSSDYLCAVQVGDNPSLPDTFDILSSITGDVPNEFYWFGIERDAKGFDLLLPGPFSDCLGAGFHRFRLSVTVAWSGTFPVRCFRVFIFACEKYTEGFVVCQVV